MFIQILLLLLSMGCLYSQYVEASSVWFSEQEEHYDTTEERVIVLLGDYLRDNHTWVKELVLGEKPLGDDRDYAHLSEGDQEKIDAFIYSRLLTKAMEELPFTEGALIAAFMSIQHLDPLDLHPHKEAYRHLGISDDQVKTAKELIQQNFEDIQKGIENDYNLTKRSPDLLRGALGSRILALLEEHLEIQTEEAIEIFTHLQRLERRDHYEWRKQETTEGVAEGVAENDEKKTAFSLDLLNTYQGLPQPTHLQRNWKHYLGLTAAGIGLGGGALFLLSHHGAES